ncbi:MAG: hypothetical protein JWO56_2836 [Acidobacteria bacterium]|nr:hypothetical protein [Acidobacteriota bacterium]
MIRRFLSILLIVSLIFLAACGGGSSVATWFGASEPAPVTPLAIDTLCDGSGGSSCTESTLAETLGIALAAAAPRPGSLVRVWVQGRDVEGTIAACTVQSPAVRRTGQRAIRDAEQRWVAKSREEILRAVRPRLGRHAHRSPVAEAVSRVALAAAPSEAARWIVVVSDGLEVSAFGDFECGKLPTPSNFVGEIQRERVLIPGSLRAVHVRMCHVDLTPIAGGRCPVSLRRAAEVRTLWTTAFKAAGAGDVELIDGGLPANAFMSTPQGGRHDR